MSWREFGNLGQRTTAQHSTCHSLTRSGGTSVVLVASPVSECPSNPTINFGEARSFVLQLNKQLLRKYSSLLTSRRPGRSAGCKEDREGRRRTQNRRKCGFVVRAQTPTYLYRAALVNLEDLCRASSPAKEQNIGCRNEDRGIETSDAIEVYCTTQESLKTSTSKNMTNASPLAMLKPILS